MNNSKRNQVFISYCHKDSRFLKELRVHLKPFIRTGLVAWSDQQIDPGSEWFKEIEAALKKAKVAVMMVSPDFLASDFIHKHELGPLLEKAEKGGVRILWIPIRTSAYRMTALKKYQAVIPLNKPIAEMKAGRDKAWVAICEAIAKEVNAEQIKSTVPVTMSEATLGEQRRGEEERVAHSNALKLKRRDDRKRNATSTLVARVEMMRPSRFANRAGQPRPKESVAAVPAVAEETHRMSWRGRPRVLVVGSLQKDEPQFKQFRGACREIGRVLARHDLIVVASSRKETAADIHVLEGANEQRAGKEPLGVHLVCPTVADKAERFPRKSFAFNKDFPNLTVTERKFIEGKLKDNRVEQVKQADAVILIGGAKGTHKAADAARRSRIPIVAVPTFGGAAKEIWARVQNSSLKRQLEDAFSAEVIVEAVKRSVQRGTRLVVQPAMSNRPDDRTVI